MLAVGLAVSLQPEQEQIVQIRVVGVLGEAMPTPAVSEPVVAINGDGLAHAADPSVWMLLCADLRFGTPGNAGMTSAQRNPMTLRLEERWPR